MLDENNLDVLAWHTIPSHLQNKVTDLWKSLERPLNEPEKDYLQKSVTEYWEAVERSGLSPDK
jgi:hypothetical protein